MYGIPTVMTKRTHKLTVMLSDAEHTALCAQADANGVSLASLVRQAIRALDTYTPEPKKKRSK